jgi:hypothetical protein
MLIFIKQWPCLRFELSWLERQDARHGLEKMCRAPPGRAWRPAVGAQSERSARPLHSPQVRQVIY